MFERKWQSLPRFQRTRGVLRLLALWVSYAFQEEHRKAARDPRKRNRLNEGQEFFLEYLLLAGPDKKDWKWIARAVERARAFMERSKSLLNTRQGSEKVAQGAESDAANPAP